VLCSVGASLQQNTLLADTLSSRAASDVDAASVACVAGMLPRTVLQLPLIRDFLKELEGYSIQELEEKEGLHTTCLLDWALNRICCLVFVLTVKAAMEVEMNVEEVLEEIPAALLVHLVKEVAFLPSELDKEVRELSR